MNNKFSKAERLNSKKEIDQLFEKGSEKTDSVFLYPFRVVYQSPIFISNEGASILISVPKRSFKKAVQRNLLKRRIREAFRLNKNLLYTAELSILPLNIGFMYVGKEILPYEIIEEKMKAILQKIVFASIQKINTQT